MNPETTNWFAAWVVGGLLFGGWVALQLTRARRLWIEAGMVPPDVGAVRFWRFVFFDRALGFEQLQTRVRYAYLVMVGYMFLGYFAFFRHTS